MSLAIKPWILNETQDIAGLEDAEKRQQEIMASPDSRQEIEETLIGFISNLSGDIYSRGLLNLEELQILFRWIEENGKHAIPSAQALSKLMKRPDTEFTLQKKVIIDAVLSSKQLLGAILDMVGKGALQLHQEIRRSELHNDGDTPIVGQGAVGTVSSAYWNGIEVAVKGFDGSDAKVIKEFDREIGLLSLIHHENIVTCYGASTDPKDTFIVEELLLANLFEVLHNSNLPISQTMKLNFANGIASGMMYLHKCHIIHRDLKSLNVLVGANFEVKICDFGLSRFCDKNSNTTMTSNIGTVCWVAPEIFARKHYNEKADVYSFAIVFWEILTRSQPFGGVPLFSVPMLVTKGDRPSIPKEAPREWARLIRKCWAKKPTTRPSFDEICAQIKDLKVDLSSGTRHREKRKMSQPQERPGAFGITFPPEHKRSGRPLSGSGTNKAGSWSAPFSNFNESSGSSSSSFANSCGSPSVFGSSSGSNPRSSRVNIFTSSTDSESGPADQPEISSYL